VFHTVFLACTTRLYPDCGLLQFEIDTIAPDSYLVTQLHDQKMVLTIDTISPSEFNDELLNRFDSQKYRFLGRVDTVIRLNFREGWLYGS